MTETIQFNDRALDQVIQSSASKFANFQLYLNNLSSDIKSLEKWLQSCSVCVTASVEIESEENHHDYLTWSSRNGDWRILYETPSADYGHNDDYQFDSTPLIETPVPVRLRCAPFLPTLVTKLASMLPTVDGEEPKKQTATKKKAVTPPEDLDAIFTSEDEIPF